MHEMPSRAAKRMGSYGLRLEVRMAFVASLTATLIASLTATLIAFLTASLIASLLATLIASLIASPLPP